MAQSADEELNIVITEIAPMTFDISDAIIDITLVQGVTEGIILKPFSGSAQYELPGQIRVWTSGYCPTASPRWNAFLSTFMGSFFINPVSGDWEGAVRKSLKTILPADDPASVDRQEIALIQCPTEGIKTHNFEFEFNVTDWFQHSQELGTFTGGIDFYAVLE